MLDLSPKEMKEFPGFFKIHGFDKYVVSVDGRVINTVSGKEIKGSVNPAGYHNFRITDERGYCYTIGRHRLLGMVFKHPGVNIDDLVINHINGIKGDDRLTNLEWVTHQGNLIHASKMGLNDTCQPISVRDVDTGEVIKYDTISECARRNGLSKDAVCYRVRIGEERVFPERKQYRANHSDAPWYVPVNVDKALLLNTTSKPVIMRHVVTGIECVFKQSSELASFLKVSQATISQWLRLPNQPVLPGLIQIKWGIDETPWRVVDDPFEELQRFTVKRPVKVLDTNTGDIEIFSSAIECAREKGLTPTALNYRLKTPRSSVYSDGCKYRYYSDSF